MADRQQKDQGNDSGLPGGGRGRVDVTGKINVRPTGDWEEGKPGYDESGSSEVIPPGRPPAGEKPEDVKPQ